MKYVHRIILTLMTLMVTGVVVWAIVNGGDYYVTSKLSRPHHPSHDLWKPGGNIGHGLGIMGGSMMIIMFVYSLRKRVKFFRKWGKLPTWLNYHIFMGIAGPILVTFHTALKFGGLVSISYWSMVAVALSGFIGRYIYIKIPRHVSGIEFSREEFKARIEKLTDEFKEEFKLSDDDLQLIHDLSGADQIRKRGMLGIFTLFAVDISGWIKWRRFLKLLAERGSIPKGKMTAFRKQIRAFIKMNRQIAFWNAAHKLFHYWHVIHKPFAYTMIVIMFIHIAVALSLGFRWIL